MADEAAVTAAESGVEAPSTSPHPPGAEEVSPPDSAVVADDPKAIPTERETAFLRNLRKQEKALVEEKKRFTTQRDQTKAERDALTRDREAFEQAKQEQATRDRMFREDPLNYAMQHLGVRDEDLARRWVGGGKASPQEIERRRQEEFNAALAKRDEDILALKKQNDDRNAQEQAQRRQAGAQAAVTAFCSAATRLAAQFPLAAKMAEADRSEFVDEGDRIASALHRAGHKWASNDALHLDVLSRIEAKYAKLTGAKAPAAQAATQESAKADPQGTRVEPKTAPTLTGKSASQRASVTPEDDPLLDVLDKAAGRKRAMKAIELAEAEHRKNAAH